MSCYPLFPTLFLGEQEQFPQRRICVSHPDPRSQTSFPELLSRQGEVETASLQDRYEYERKVRFDKNFKCSNLFNESAYMHPYGSEL